MSRLLRKFASLFLNAWFWIVVSDADRFGMREQCRCWGGSKNTRLSFSPKVKKRKKKKKLLQNGPSLAGSQGHRPREPSLRQSIRTPVGDPVLDSLQKKRTLRYSKYFSHARNCPGRRTTDPHVAVKSRNPVGQNRGRAFLFPSQCLFFESFISVLVVFIHFVRI